jgi:hypothetical protein
MVKKKGKNKEKDILKKWIKIKEKIFLIEKKLKLCLLKFERPN